MPNKIWFFPIDRAAVKAPFEERQGLTPDQGCDAAEWAIANGAFIELYVQDESDTELGMPMVGWTVGFDRVVNSGTSGTINSGKGDKVGFGLGHDRTAGLESEVMGRLEGQKLGYERAWFKSLLERSLTA